MSPSTSTCLPEGRGSLILPAPVLLSVGNYSSSTSALGRTVSWITHSTTLTSTSPCRGTLDLNLPRMLVVGSQSVGKSSLIERISGVRLKPSDLKFIADPSRIDNPASRQWHMHQVSYHYQGELSKS